MKIINASYELITPIDGKVIIERIEKISRTCYKSEDKITQGSAEKLIKNIIARDHTAMLEHITFSVKFISSRGFHNENVRHRIASYAAESTRYCSYDKGKFGSEITVVEPVRLRNKQGSKDYEIWKNACLSCEKAYFDLLAEGWQAQDARGVLPLDLKNETVMTANLRSWRNFFKLRTAEDAHPAMKELARPLLTELKQKIPMVFDDIPSKWGRG